MTCPLRFRAVTLAVGLIAIGACSSVGFRPRVGSSVSGIGARGRENPRPVLDAGIRMPNPGQRPLASNERRVCKSAGWPRGWVATMYEPTAGECPSRRGADSSGMMAVITRYEVLPKESILDICADQIVPGGWHLVSREPEGAGDLCPGANKSGTNSVMRIRRIH